MVLHSDKDQRFCDAVEAAINDPSLRAVFDALEINAADAWALFQQLDSVARLQRLTGIRRSEKQWGKTENSLQSFGRCGSVRMATITLTWRNFWKAGRIVLL